MSTADPRSSASPPLTISGFLASARQALEAIREEERRLFSLPPPSEEPPFLLFRSRVPDFLREELDRRASVAALFGSFA